MEIVVHIIIRGMYFTRIQQRRRTRRKKFNLPSYHITSYYYRTVLRLRGLLVVILLN